MAFPVILRLQYKGRPVGKDEDRPEGIAIRAWRAVVKDANRAMAYHWHEKFLPMHFGSGARRRYGSAAYKERTQKWLSEKLGIKYADVNRVAGVSPSDTKEQRQRKLQVARQKLVAAAGGANYNVDTGTLQRTVKNAIFRAFPSRFRIEMQAPSYIPGRRRDPTQPDIRAELTTMLRTEIDELQRVGQRVLTQSMKVVMQSGRVPVTREG